jgi:ankyrin repeat protein
MSGLSTMARGFWTALLAEPLGARARARLEITLGVVLSGAAMVALAGVIEPDPSRLKRASLPPPSAPSVPAETHAAGSDEARKVPEVPPGFLDAVRTGDRARMNALYVRGVPLDGMLSIAAGAGQKGAVEWLLARGANIHEFEGTFEAPILRADRYPEVVSMLLARGAKEATLSVAATAGAPAAIDRLLEAHAPVNPRGASPLYEALATTRLELGPKRRIVDRLLAAGADPEHEATTSSPLGAAVTNCTGSSEPGPAASFCMPVLSWLLSRGARVRGDALAAAIQLEEPERESVLTLLLNEPRVPGATAVALATVGAPKHIVKRLVSLGIDWAWHDGEDDSALPVLAAVQRHDRDGLRELLDTGAPADRRYKEPATALGAAIEEEEGRIVELLVERGADPNRRLPDGRTPLFAAAETGNLRIVNFLIDRGARVNDVVLEESALDAAEQHGQLAVARLLDARGGHRVRRGWAAPE